MEINNQIQYKQTEVGLIPEDWEFLKLGDLLDRIIDNRGKTPPISKNGVKLIETFHMSMDSKYPDLSDSFKQKYVDENVYSNWFRAGHPEKDDILFSTVGASIPQWCYPPINEKSCIAQNLIALKVDKQKIIPEYLRQYFRTNVFRDLVNGILLTTAQPSIKVPHLLSLSIAVPPLKEQQKIAEVLGVLDEKIELNRKMNKTLESLGQAIFKRWFIDEANPNWEIKKLEDAVDIISRGPSLNYIKEGGIPVLNQRCVRNDEIELEAIQTAEQLNSNKEHLYLNKNDILINSMGEGTLGRISRNLSIDYKMIIHNCITVIRANEKITSQYLLYYQFKNFEQELTSMGAGTTGQTSLKPEIIKQIEIIIPPKTIIQRFDQQVSSIWLKIGRNKKEIETLSQIRDSLLPRLMSGKLRVR